MQYNIVKRIQSVSTNQMCHLIQYAGCMQQTIMTYISISALFYIINNKPIDKNKMNLSL